MPQGLQIFDGNGRTVMDTSTRNSFVFGVISNITASGTLTDPRFADGIPFGIFPNYNAGTLFGSFGLVRFDGITMRWTIADIFLPFIGDLIYGVVQ